VLFCLRSTDKSNMCCRFVCYPARPPIPICSRSILIGNKTHTDGGTIVHTFDAHQLSYSGPSSFFLTHYDCLSPHQLGKTTHIAACMCYIMIMCMSAHTLYDFLHKLTQPLRLTKSSYTQALFCRSPNIEEGCNM
jgi:hypothetical protein